MIVVSRLSSSPGWAIFSVKRRGDVFLSVWSGEHHFDDLPYWHELPGPSYPTASAAREAAGPGDWRRRGGRNGFELHFEREGESATLRQARA